MSSKGVGEWLLRLPLKVSGPRPARGMKYDASEKIVPQLESMRLGHSGLERRMRAEE